MVAAFKLQHAGLCSGPELGPYMGGGSGALAAGAPGAGDMRFRQAGELVL